MTNHERLQENYENAVISLLMEEYAQDEGERYIKLNEQLENDPEAAVPLDVERRALKLIEREFSRQSRKKGGKHFLRILGHVAVAAVIVVAMFGSAFALSPAFRAGTLNLLMRIDDRAASWQFFAGDEKESSDISDLVINWLPEGYSRGILQNMGDYNAVIECNNTSGNSIWVSIHVGDDFINCFDIEDADWYYDNTIQGNPGIIAAKDGLIRVGWVDPSTGYIIYVQSANAEINTLIRMAESIRIE